MVTIGNKCVKTGEVVRYPIFWDSKEMRIWLLEGKVCMVHYFDWQIKISPYLLSCMFLSVMHLISKCECPIINKHKYRGISWDSFMEVNLFCWSCIQSQFRFDMSFDRKYTFSHIIYPNYNISFLCFPQWLHTHTIIQIHAFSYSH